MATELDLQAFLNILLLLGVLQGLIVALLLVFSKKPSSKANVLLASWVLALVLSNVRIVIDTEELYQLLGQQVTLMLPFSFSLLYGPLLFFFVKSITDRDFRLEKRLLWHLLPGLIEFLYYLIAWLQPLEYKQWFFGQVHWKWVEPGLEVVAVLSFTLYLLYAVKALKAYQKDVNEQFSATDIETYDWLQRLIYVLIILLSFWVLLTFTDVVIMGYRLPYLYFYPYYIAITYICYFIGYAGYFRPETVVLMEKRADPVSREIIGTARLDELKEALNQLLCKHQLFLNPGLKASDLAGRLEISVQTLSYVFNQGLGQSFNDHINQLRVEHVKQRLKTADLKLMSLMGIAQESGFNSESSFYRIFKQHTGITPKAFVDSLKG